MTESWRSSLQLVLFAGLFCDELHHCLASAKNILIAIAIASGSKQTMVRFSLLSQIPPTHAYFVLVLYKFRVFLQVVYIFDLVCAAARS